MVGEQTSRDGRSRAATNSTLCLSVRQRVSLFTDQVSKSPILEAGFHQKSLSLSPQLLKPTLLIWISSTLLLSPLILLPRPLHRCTLFTHSITSIGSFPGHPPFSALSRRLYLNGIRRIHPVLPAARAALIDTGSTETQSTLVQQQPSQTFDSAMEYPTALSHRSL